MENRDSKSPKNKNPFDEFRKMFEQAKSGGSQSNWVDVSSTDQSPDDSQTQPPNQDWRSPDAVAPNQTSQLFLDNHQIHDSQAGCDAATVLKPVDWQVQSNFAWNVDLRTPAEMSIQVWNPQGSEVVDFLPSRLMSWDVGPNSTSAMLQQMAMMSGMPMAPPEQPPQSVSDFVWRYVIPYQRQWAGSVKWIAEEALPEVRQAYQQDIFLPGIIGSTSEIQAARVRTTHYHQNRLYEEDFYCVFLLTAVPQNGLQMWSPLRLYSIRAVQGQLEQATQLCHTIANSFHVTAEWQHMYEKVGAILKGIRDDNRMASMEMHKTRMESQREINEMYRDTHRKRQAAQDRANERFSRYIRDVDAFHHPNGGIVEAPIQYKYVWRSEGGRYVFSDDLSYNPNQHLSGNWTNLQRVN